MMLYVTLNVNVYLFTSSHHWDNQEEYLLLIIDYKYDLIAFLH